MRLPLAIFLGCLSASAADSSFPLALTKICIGPAQPGDIYQEYFYPITTNVVTQFATNVVTNFHGGWTGGYVRHRVVLHWTGRAGSNYVVESSVDPVFTPVPGTTNQGWIGGDSWNPCSLPMSGINGEMGWTNGIPDQQRFFRLRVL